MYSFYTTFFVRQQICEWYLEYISREYRSPKMHGVEFAKISDSMVRTGTSSESYDGDCGKP